MQAQTGLCTKISCRDEGVIVIFREPLLLLKRLVNGIWLRFLDIIARGRTV
jgi:hypothetical protein